MAITLGLGALGLGAGVANSQAQQAQRKRDMMANAAAIQYSPWTGMNPGMMAGTPDNTLGAAIGGASEGAVTGLLLGRGTKKPGVKDPFDSTGQTAQPLGQGQTYDMTNASNPWDGMQTMYGRRRPGMMAGDQGLADG